MQPSTLATPCTGFAWRTRRSLEDDMHSAPACCLEFWCWLKITMSLVSVVQSAERSHSQGLFRLILVLTYFWCGSCIKKKDPVTDSSASVFHPRRCMVLGVMTSKQWTACKERRSMANEDGVEMLHVQALELNTVLISSILVAGYMTVCLKLKRFHLVWGPFAPAG